MPEIYRSVVSVELFSTYKNQRLFNFTEEKLRYLATTIIVLHIMQNYLSVA
jgi:hypothetical protein